MMWAAAAAAAGAAGVMWFSEGYFVVYRLRALVTAKNGDVLVID